MMPAGWYPDPFTAGATRWWDGTAWTPYSQWAPPGFDARTDLAGEESAAKWARIGVFAGAGLAILGNLIIAAYFGHELHRLIHQIRDDIHAAHQGTATSNRFGLGGPSLALDAFQALSFAAQVPLMIWLYRAATVARRAGLPARRQPTWAWLGFLVPVVSLWFPYQVAADAIPADQPGRRSVGWWWACWIAQTVLSIPIAVASYFSRPAALVLAIGLSAVPLATAARARAMIGVTVAAHRRILNITPTR